MEECLIAEGFLPLYNSLISPTTMSSRDSISPGEVFLFGCTVLEKVIRIALERKDPRLKKDNNFAHLLDSESCALVYGSDLVRHLCHLFAVI